MMKVLHKTTALCPTCLRELPASVFADEDGVVWMERTCPDHGRLATRMWPDAEHYQWLRSLAFSKTAPTNTIPATAPGERLRLRYRKSPLSDEIQPVRTAAAYEAGIRLAVQPAAYFIPPVLP